MNKSLNLPLRGSFKKILWASTPLANQKGNSGGLDFYRKMSQMQIQTQCHGTITDFLLFPILLINFFFGSIQKLTQHYTSIGFASLQNGQHWRRKWQPNPVFLPGESHRRGSLVGYSLQDQRESDTTEQLTWGNALLCCEKTLILRQFYFLKFNFLIFFHIQKHHLSLSHTHTQANSCLHKSRKNILMHKRNFSIFYNHNGQGLHGFRLD